MYGGPPGPPPFPTRRSSDLAAAITSRTRAVVVVDPLNPYGTVQTADELAALARLADEHDLLLDRKSTRLNSSHANISYAVFCLKKKEDSQMLELEGSEAARR